jgi:response regulator RpfG family c-di-GMP phosphodiesterase
MAHEQQRVTVMLVDDEENVLLSLQRLLMDEDFDIVTATSGEIGLEKLKTLENVGLIVADLRMPGMDGAEFLKRSCELFPNAQRVFLTGLLDVKAALAALTAGGAKRYFSKPWNNITLKVDIREQVELYKQGGAQKSLSESSNQDEGSPS